MVIRISREKSISRIEKSRINPETKNSELSLTGTEPLGGFVLDRVELPHKEFAGVAGIITPVSGLLSIIMNLQLVLSLTVIVSLSGISFLV
ncbi:MAG: hypothetical protein Q8S04_10865 [Bacteroidales bacterium]|nr:hypothetical protein [Bacteroidales bacterium]